MILGIPVPSFSIPRRKHCEVDDGAIYINDIVPAHKPLGLDQIIRDCAQDYLIGHRAFKIKIGRGFKWMPPEEGLARDIEVVKLVHGTFSDAQILVDGNDGFTTDTMIRFIEGIGLCPLYWIEEPFREDEGNNGILRAYLDKNMPGTLVADGESRPDIAQLLDLAQKRL